MKYAPHMKSLAAVKYAAAYAQISFHTPQAYFTTRSVVSHREAIFHYSSLIHAVFKLSEVPPMPENKLLDLSMDFAIASLKFCDTVSGHHSIKNQFERSSTSVGANIREANYAQSRLDFVAKLRIALKECYESEYWLELFERSSIANTEEVSGLRQTAGHIRRLLIASINTAKGNPK